MPLDAPVTTAVLPLGLTGAFMMTISFFDQSISRRPPGAAPS